MKSRARASVSKVDVQAGGSEVSCSAGHHNLESALSCRLLFTHWPKGSQMASFSCGFVFAANPLVAVATNTAAPGQSAVLPIRSLSFCHPYWNSSFLIARLYRQRQMDSQIPLPTIHTASGRKARIFSSRTGVPAADSALLSSAACLEGRATIFVFPMLYNLGKSTSCSGLNRISVHPELCRSFQNILEG